MNQSTTEQFIKKARNTHRVKYDYSNSVYKNSNEKIEIICPIHGSFFMTPKNHLRGSNCQKCSRKNRKTTKKFVFDSIKVHGDKYDYSKVKYFTKRVKVEIICKEHGSFLQLPYVHLRGSNCPKCARSRKTTERFISDSIEVHGDKYDYSKVVYISSHEKVEIVCPIHGSFYQMPYSHLGGNNCPICKNRKTTEQFISDAIEVHGDKYDYSKVYYINAEVKVEIICKKHGSFLQDPHSHLRGSNCPKCKLSKGELKIELLLKGQNVSYESQKKFNWCKNKMKLPFDFYLPEYNACIEYDGEQHFKIVDFFNGKEGFNYRKINDKIKTDFCNENEIHLIRIPYYEFKNIKEILINNLGDIII